MKKHPLVHRCLLAAVLLAPLFAKLAAAETPSLFEHKNIVAWCIVPFDSVKRGPAERAEMVNGHFAIESSPAEGTAVTVEIPLVPPKQHRKAGVSP